jgi:hypothetical protein
MAEILMGEFRFPPALAQLPGRCGASGAFTFIRQIVRELRVEDGDVECFLRGQNGRETAMGVLKTI